MKLRKHCYSSCGLGIPNLFVHKYNSTVVGCFMSRLYALPLLMGLDMTGYITGVYYDYIQISCVHGPVSYTHLDVYKRQD